MPNQITLLASSGLLRTSVIRVLVTSTPLAFNPLTTFISQVTYFSTEIEIEIILTMALCMIKRKLGTQGIQ